MTDSRNFRASYLERVGIKGVEEKKSLEIFLKERPLDTVKISQFLLRFPIPVSYRLMLWKVLLGVVPIYQEIQEFAEQQRSIQYNDMHEALVVMGRINKDTPLAEVHLRMFLLDKGCLPFNESKLFQDQDNQCFLSMASAVADITECPVEMFWITTKFCLLQEKFKSALPVMMDRVEHYVKEEDNGQLHNHLKSLNVYSSLPLNSWFRACYAEVLPINCIEKLWDKIIGGSCHILLFVAVSILLTLKRTLLSMKTGEDILKYLTKIPKDTGDRIISISLELWQKYGSLLMPNFTKPDSPAVMDRKA